jgi:predicted ATP-dependent endonuclease of OLD family
LYEKQLRVSEDKLYHDKEEFIPLKIKTNLEDILKGLIKDGFEIDYTVTYKGDNLLHMSPGKKGTVLLILFLQISSSEFPILIDQPEDNLDNRTIYDLLCKMIKEKKKDRQIIIVSHNANLVVATDTENIIVANQRGQDGNQDTSQYRFEYVNGALEHSFCKDETIKSVLECQGIREHVCDILEGGGEAFKQREKKYSIRL